ncbi:hypothetical protein BDA96_02G264800 [Sorghum bicolor]|uniref:Uncharacterized protein n=1 Tax=Sorghum bicolor TaxID=4558 RepID=A0A921UTU3_SORBI|nr:hypothetical protein BDA96_02G264800 [Sorghum bicolor]
MLTPASAKDQHQCFPTSCHSAIHLKASQRGFDSMCFLVSWMIWKEHNDRTLDTRPHRRYIWCTK